MENLNLQELENVNGGDMADVVAACALAVGSVAMTIAVQNTASTVRLAVAICNFADKIQN